MFWSICCVCSLEACGLDASTTYRPAHKILIPIVYVQILLINAHTSWRSKFWSTLCMLAAKTQVSLGICPDSPEPWLQADAISTEMSCFLRKIMIKIKNLDTVVI